MRLKTKSVLESAFKCPYLLRNVTAYTYVAAPLCAYCNSVVWHFIVNAISPSVRVRLLRLGVCEVERSHVA